MLAETIVNILSLIFAIFFTVRPVRSPRIFSVKWGRQSRFNFHLHLNEATAPWVALIPLYAMGVLEAGETFSILYSGSSSVPGLSMVNLLIMFQSLAYLCFSMDETGLFRWATKNVIRRYGGSPRALFNIIFGTSSLLTLFASNDIVVMTLTPMIFYAFDEVAPVQDEKTRALGLLPYLFAQFYAANTWSTLFSISNTTNLLVAESRSWSFLFYLKWMALPTFVAGIVLYACLYIRFARHLTNQPFVLIRGASLQELSNTSAKRSSFEGFKRPVSGLTSAFIFVICLILLTALSDVPSWIIVLVSACLVLVIDCVADYLEWRKFRRALSKRKRTASDLFGKNYFAQLVVKEKRTEVGGENTTSKQLPPATEHELEAGLARERDDKDSDNSQATEQVLDSVIKKEVESSDSSLSHPSNPIYQNQEVSVKKAPELAIDTTIVAVPVIDGGKKEGTSIPNPNLVLLLEDEIKDRMDTRMERESIPDFGEFQSNFWLVVQRLPWTLLPFVCGMFMLVIGLEKTGVTLHYISPLFPWLLKVGGPVFLMIGTTITACIVGNLTTNQPMTFLWLISCLGVISNPVETNAVGSGWSSKTEQLSLFAIVLSSNFACNFTLLGALSGLMWVSILDGLVARKKRRSSASLNEPQGLPKSIMNYAIFVYNGLFIIPFVVTASIFTLYLEYLFFTD